MTTQKLLKSFFKGVEGATSIEYGVLGGMMALIAIGAAMAMADSIEAVYRDGIVAKVTAATSAPPP